MDLKKFYFKNVKEFDYHYRFFDAIQNVNVTYNFLTDKEEINDYKFEIYDVEEAITKFRELCQPGINFADNENKCWFYLILFYLYSMGYEVKEFPRIIERPPVEPTDFTCKEIRNRIIAEGNDDKGTVRYAERRKYVAAMTFMQKPNHIDVNGTINQKFIEISNRQASFNNMSVDEKLSEIANLIENLLKKDNKFIALDYSKICFSYVTNEMVTKYRKQMHCFRHASSEAIEERKTFTEEQKSFLVDFGLTIVKVIYEIVKLDAGT